MELYRWRYAATLALIRSGEVYLFELYRMDVKADRY
jgi:hypothetical protein